MLHGVKGWSRMGSLHLEVTYVERRSAWCVILELLFARDSPPIARKHILLVKPLHVESADPSARKLSSSLLVELYR